MPIIRYAAAEVDRSDPGVGARRLVNSLMGSQSFTAGISTFEPGAGIFLHTHPCEEIVVILDGEAVGEVAGEISDVRAFDVSFVPPGVPHRFLNKSDKPFTMMYVYPTTEVTRDPVDPADAPASGEPHR
jgi:putative monooxygenase